MRAGLVGTGASISTVVSFVSTFPLVTSRTWYVHFTPVLSGRKPCGQAACCPPLPPPSAEGSLPAEHAPMKRSSAKASGTDAGPEGERDGERESEARGELVVVLNILVLSRFGATGSRRF